MAASFPWVLLGRMGIFPPDPGRRPELEEKADGVRCLGPVAGL